MLHQPRSLAGSHRPVLSELSERSREIFRLVVDAYVETGEPVGSRTLSRLLGASLSPATIRNVMSDLEEMGLLFSPHTSAGRLPTDFGFRLFVDGLMEIGGLTEAEPAALHGKSHPVGLSMPGRLEPVSTMPAGPCRCAGPV